jgi:hypothetical protein
VFCASPFGRNVTDLATLLHSCALVSYKEQVDA